MSRIVLTQYCYFARGAYFKLREGYDFRPFEPDPVHTGVGKRRG